TVVVLRRDEDRVGDLPVGDERLSAGERAAPDAGRELRGIPLVPVPAQRPGYDRGSLRDGGKPACCSFAVAGRDQGLGGQRAREKRSGGARRAELLGGEGRIQQ